MTISTTKFRRRAAGFSLIEIMVGATLGSMVLAGILSTFLMLGRSGANAANYSEMDAEARRALEEFAQDLRMSSNLTWNSTGSITLTVPDYYTTTANQVTYAYDSAATGATARSFYRKPGNAAATTPTTILVRNVATFTYARFNRLDAATTTDASTKRIQLTMTLRTATQTVVAATNHVVSASYILRNKTAN